MSKSVKIVLAIIAIGIAVFFIWYGLSKNQNATDQSLKIGLNPWIGHGLYYVAKEKGFFDKEGVNVELVNFDDGAVGKQLLNTDKVDALSLTPETVVILADAGASVRVVAITDTSEGADGIIAAKDIKNISDLKSKKVAFEVGSPSHFFLSYLLNQNGLTTNDLEVVNEVAPDAGVSFVAGKVDAAVTWEPWLSQANERQGGHLIASSRVAPILPAMPIFRTEVVENRPDDIKKMMRALFAARDFIMSNHKEADPIIMEAFNLSQQDLDDQYKTFRWLNYQDSLSELDKGQYSATNLIQSAANLWLKLGLIKTKINASSLVDTSILKNLYQ